MLNDIYDGKIWKEFQSFNDQPFLSESGNYALMMNFDYFQPYKHIQYSLGAIYLTVLNLPRGIRNKQENVILVGLIPGPNEPKHDLNSYLEPFVNDLLKLWDGVELNISAVNYRKIIRCALLCVSCDLPAGRKACGFLGHAAHLGCSRCLKRFTGGVGNMDYSGFDREKWVLCSGSDHKRKCLNILDTATQSERNSLESSSGCRYSVLVCLPYFDSPRMLVVDPMHNLFLGSAKHYMKGIFINRGILSDENFKYIQTCIDSFRVPADIGRIPHKISTSFASFTADQWKNWTIYFSMIVLRDIVSSDILECWRHFVLACRILCHYKISEEQLKLGDALLLQFCRRTERLFGKSCITPNMHMHAHLCACTEDYGPLHGYWLFPFERYNGILGSMPNNNKSIENQLMSRFIREGNIISAQLPNEYADEFTPILPSSCSIGSVSDTLSTSSISSVNTSWVIDSSICVPSYSCRGMLNPTEKSHLIELYSDLHNVSRSTIEISSVCIKYLHITMHGKQLGSHNSRMASSSVVLATWDNELFYSESSPDKLFLQA